MRPAVPAAVAELVARMMAKKPHDRFASAGEVAAALAPRARYPAESVVVPVVAVHSHGQGAVVAGHGAAGGCGRGVR